MRVNNKRVLFGNIESTQGDYLAIFNVNNDHTSFFPFLSFHNERKSFHGGHFSFLLPGDDEHKGELDFTLSVINLKCKTIIYKKTMSLGMTVTYILHIILIAVCWAILSVNNA